MKQANRIGGVACHGNSNECLDLKPQGLLVKQGDLLTDNPILLQPGNAPRHL